MQLRRSGCLTRVTREMFDEVAIHHENFLEGQVNRQHTVAHFSLLHPATDSFSDVSEKQIVFKLLANIYWQVGGLVSVGRRISLGAATFDYRGLSDGGQLGSMKTSPSSLPIYIPSRS